MKKFILFSCLAFFGCESHEEYLRSHQYYEGILQNVEYLSSRNYEVNPVVITFSDGRKVKLNTYGPSYLGKPGLKYRYYYSKYGNIILIDLK